jgi:hypothetical protein
MPAPTSAEHELVIMKDVPVLGDYPVYPQGWTNVAKKAKAYGINLGLWAEWKIPLDKLIQNYDSADFKSFKLDFAYLNNIHDRLYLMDKARQLIIHSNYNTCVNWDITETAARSGYFYGREYGNLYFANRKIISDRPKVKYMPYKVLRDAWLLAKYVNLNKLQVSVQNIELDPVGTYRALYGKDYEHEVPQEVLEADRDIQAHNHPYVFGIAAMASPIFFGETQFYTPEARDALRPLIARYKEHRLSIDKGYVFPIGSIPDNHSWTGFQSYDPDTRSGYLTVFRERHNEESSYTFDMHFVDDTSLVLTDLSEDEAVEQQVSNGRFKVKIESPASFRFYRYREIGTAYDGDH